jgi:hypothetical protein
VRRCGRAHRWDRLPLSPFNVAISASMAPSRGRQIRRMEQLRELGCRN